MKDAQSLVLVILAVLGAVSPVIFGFMVFKLTRLFVSREMFEAYKVVAEQQRTEMLDRVREIDKNVVKILEIRVTEAAVLAAARRRDH
jgi:biopolymer transport protein ExbB/TolQ